MAANSANRRQISAVLETTLGVTPVTPRMRQKVVTAEALKYAPTLVDSAEMRSDRMTSDSVVTGLDSSGPMTWEFHFPYPDSVEDFDIRSAFYNNWVLTPLRDNDTVAGSVITAAAVGALTVLTGASFQIGHLVRTTGFNVAANNTIAKVTTAGATSVTATGAYAIEASPPGTARAKVVGFQGASGDITANATGLASTTLDFTTLGLAVGQWIKIGGTAATDRFILGGATANNGRARIIGIAAHQLTLDNLPAGWAVDAGTTRTIKVWFGDRIVNGTTQISQTIERGDLGMNVPVYMVSPGMVVASLAFSIKPKVIITAVATYMGMAAAAPNSTTTLDAVLDPAPAQALFPQFAGSANVGSMRENGVQLTSPNWCIGLDFTIANNIQPAETIDGVGPQDLVPGECLVTGVCNTIYGDATLLNRFLGGTPTNLNLALQKNNQMVFISFPRVVFNSDGAVNANAKNQIINASFGFRASKDDSLTGVIVSMDRLEYFEQ